MKNSILIFFFFCILITKSNAQKDNPVLIEVFTETGCGACSANDSAFEAVVNANHDKVAVISYHCFYMLDTFYQYNKACDERYIYYKLKGYPSAMTNGAEPSNGSAHLSYVNSSLINSLSSKPAQFKIELSSTPGDRKNPHALKIKAKATALQDNQGNDIRLFIAITENNINHEQRYHSKAVNGLARFNHILRALLPGNDGTAIGSQKKGKVNTVKVDYVNDDKEINFKEITVVAFVQDMITKEVLGTATFEIR